ncbi:endo-1,3-beta-glucanase [Phlyctema vagabunda]|uniref:Endo-1,3-beta-glucanase n=1 Tax=Phlyctema vagabunda TaxID=108571 RepID=A0ABR4P214_9HELO
MKIAYSSLAFILATTIEAHTPSHSHHHQKRNLLPGIKLGYSTTFFDSFAGETGCLPSREKWLFSTGTSYPGGAPRWGNNEFETYTDSTENVIITESNKLRITPRLGRDGSWTSARLETQRTDFAAVEGGKLYVETRIKLGDAPKEVQQGIWPAFWALGESFRGNYTNWPAASEWDILEVLNGLPTIYSTIHCGVAPGGPCNEYNGLGNGGVDFSFGAYHTIGFGVDRSMTGPNGHYRNSTWKDERLEFFLDGDLVFNVTGATVGDRPAWEKLAHEGHFLLLNVAVGGNWPGPPNNATIGGDRAAMEVDYVAVFNSL